MVFTMMRRHREPLASLIANYLAEQLATRNSNDGNPKRVTGSEFSYHATDIKRTLCIRRYRATCFDIETKIQAVRSSSRRGNNQAPDHHCHTYRHQRGRFDREYRVSDIPVCRRMPKNAVPRSHEPHGRRQPIQVNRPGKPRASGLEYAKQSPIGSVLAK